MPRPLRSGPIQIRDSTIRRFPTLLKLLERFTRTRLSHVIGGWEWLASRSLLIRESRRDPGGYLALDLVYRYEPAGRSLLERCADWYFLHSPMSIAVRMRLIVVAAWLAWRAEALLRKEGRVRVLSLACGGARDAALAFAPMPGRRQVDFLGVDANPKALEYARRLTRKAGLHHFRFERRDALDLDGRWKDQFDLVLVIGLFHYLSRDQIREALERFHDVLPPGGRLLFDVAGHHPSRRFFEEKLGWHIRCVDPDDVLALTHGTRFGASRVFCNCKNCFYVIECTRQGEDG
ncbi:MAG TPA: class I SAM-dependent methyltransferase [Planctomycetota bacterium]|nr:class I SAM-dependent methyltransferase [Planctomycetota bacterium]